MSNFIISLGLINKTLLIPIFYMIIIFGIFTYFEFFIYNEAAHFLEGISTSIGLTLLLFISIRYNNIETNNKTKKRSKKGPKKNYIKDFTIIFFAAAFYNISTFLQAYSGEIYKGEENSATDLYVNNALEIVFVTLVTYFFLKYKYYIHHFISIGAFVVLSVITDLILDNYSNRNILTIITSLFLVFVNSFNYSYFKYLIEEKYYYSFNVMCIP